MFMARDGLTVKWEDDSKTMQSSVFLKAEVGEAGRCDLLAGLT